jgi:hypothetical protein
VFANLPEILLLLAVLLFVLLWPVLRVVFAVLAVSALLLVMVLLAGAGLLGILMR